MEKFLLLYEKDKIAHAIDDRYNDVCLNQSLYKFINNLCLYHGSTVDGRLKAFGYITKIKYKPCLIISHRYNIYYLMTRSINANDVILINYLELKAFHRIDDYRTKLIFMDNKNIIINENYRIIKRQNEQMKKYLCLYLNQ